MGEVSRRGVVTAAGAVLLTAACGTADPAKKAKAAKGADPSGVAAQPVSDDIAVDPPTQLKGALFSTDVLVYSQVTLDARSRASSASSRSAWVSSTSTSR
jgi:hypothetical protein